MVTLEQLLQSRERRAERQQSLLQEFALTLICLTINKPGPEKDTNNVRRLAQYGFEQILQRLQYEQAAVYYACLEYLPTGPEAFIVTDQSAIEVKKTVIEIETAHRFSRLLDIDVLETAGQPLARTVLGYPPRTCFICGQDAAMCRRQNTHAPEAVQASVDRLFLEFDAACSRKVDRQAEQIGALAVEAMLNEVTASPSPGLVDRYNSGAHQDMDFYTFVDSSAALSLTLARCAQAGRNFSGALPELLPLLRLIGLDGETMMYIATNGVNTHKGLLFSLGIAAAAAGWCQKHGSAGHEAVLDAIGHIAAGLVAKDMERLKTKTGNLTAGERLYVEYGLTGIRGEMERGLPAIRQTGYPVLKQTLAQGVSRNDALLETLMQLMVVVEDTTVMNRHKPDKLTWLRQQASAFCQQGGIRQPDGLAKLHALDRLFIEENISPGGVADLLAVTWFLYRLETVGVKD